ncbi:MAG TPA: NUDIX domain-containing protein [Candidatus Saccharimonadales bacterium]|nr:NUDIX domain-containing protein [Candidatus Saccharimonadales bacterium]
MKQPIRQQIHDEVNQISPWDDLEQGHIADALAWIASGVNIFRIAKPDKPPKHLVSYFVLIDPDHRSLLLGDHIKAQLWLPNGGHVEPNEHPRDTVIRECMEEVYRPAVFLKQNEQPFFITCTETGGLTPGHTDVSLWYLLRGSIHDSLNFDRGEFTDMNWFSFQEVLESHPTIFDPNMHRFTQKLVAYLSR